ncbi:MAG: hypothetical protein ABL931_23410 [Usitatibacteraceae bacterium]
MLKRFCLVFLSALVVSSNGMATDDKELAHARALDCFEVAADYFVRNTSEAADLIVPAVLARCKKEVSEWAHLLAIELNRTDNIMIETSLAETESGVVEQFGRMLPPQVLITVVEARARLNAAQ